jgi:hypothetical protein
MEMLVLKISTWISPVLAAYEWSSERFKVAELGNMFTVNAVMINGAQI